MKKRMKRVRAVRNKVIRGGKELSLEEYKKLMPCETHGVRDCPSCVVP